MAECVCPYCKRPFEVKVLPITEEPEEPEEAEFGIYSLSKFLVSKGIDNDLVDITKFADGKISVSTTKRLDRDVWMRLNNALKEHGFKWVSDGARSHWGV